MPEQFNTPSPLPSPHHENTAEVDLNSATFTFKRPEATVSNSKQQIDSSITIEKVDATLAKELYEIAVKAGESTNLGQVEVRRDIECAPGEFRTYPNYKVEYPTVVVEALGEIFADEYNPAFKPLVEANREWPTDYQHCFDKNGNTVNYFVQMDMVGLPKEFLDAAPMLTKDEVKEVLRHHIFEIENSLAGYELLQKIFAPVGTMDSPFTEQFRAGLDEIRETHGKKIILLASTEEKADLMRAYEFGKAKGEQVTDAEVKDRTGFDAFMGPKEFKAYVDQNGGTCDALLFVRSSSPTAVLADPKKRSTVQNPLLEDPEMREIIKANAITFNVDSPSQTPDERINDTKSYLVSMGLAYRIEPVPNGDPLAQIFSDKFAAHLSKGKPYTQFEAGERLRPEFKEFLENKGIDPLKVETGEVMLRFKPEKDSYGAYGHEFLSLSDSDKRREVRKHIKQRGSYVIQPEMEIPKVHNVADDTNNVYIDRNFFRIGEDGKAVFMSGFRTILPDDSHEAKNRRIHGNRETAWVEIGRQMNLS